MRVLVVYDTVEGQTGKVVEFVQKLAREAGAEVFARRTSDAPLPVSFAGVDKVILAAPVHERRHPKAFEAFITENLPQLAARKTLMLSISLKAAFPDTQEDAEDFLVEMKMRTGLKPTAEALVAGAVRGKSYDYYSQMVVDQVLMSGRDIELENGEREFTDWDALRDTVTGFLKG